MKLEDIELTNSDGKKVCVKCGSDRLLYAQGGCDDTFFMLYRDNDFVGYPPDFPFTDGNDNFELVVCLECLTLQHYKPTITDEELNEMMNEVTDGGWESDDDWGIEL